MISAHGVTLLNGSECMNRQAHEEVLSLYMRTQGRLIYDTFLPFLSFAACEGCRAYRSAPTLQLIGVGVGAAVYDQSVGNAHSANTGAGGFKPFRTWDVSATSRAIGLLHFAALGGHPEAQLALGLR